MKRKAARTPCGKGGPRWCPCWVHSKPIKARPGHAFLSTSAVRAQWGTRCGPFGADRRRWKAAGLCSEGCRCRDAGTASEPLWGRECGRCGNIPHSNGAARGRKAEQHSFVQIHKRVEFFLGRQGGEEGSATRNHGQQQGSLQPWMGRSTSTAKP